jgi:choline dehydrogenase
VDPRPGHIPAGFYRNIYHPKITWQFETEAQGELGGRRLPWRLGKVLGAPERPARRAVPGVDQRADLHPWTETGFSTVAPARQYRLSYDDVLPYFRRAENQERVADAHHGAGGPPDVTDLRARLELRDAFMAAAEEAGYRRNDDFNGAEQDGVGPLQLTVRNKRRCSAGSPICARP